MPHDVFIIIIMCIVGLEKTARYEWEAWKCLWCWLPIVLLWFYRCWLLNLKKMLRCEWGWNSLWQEHALAGDHPCKLFFSQPTPVISENKRISKKWAKSCWNNAGDHYNVFFPHPKPTSTSAERERLTFKRIGQNHLNTHWRSLQYAFLPAIIIG